MSSLHHDASCSACGNGRLERITKENWMRWLPRAKHYRCRSCKTRFLKLLDGISLQLPTGSVMKSPSRSGGLNPKRVRLILLVIAVLGCMYIARSCAMREYENMPQSDARVRIPSEKTEKILKA